MFDGDDTLERLILAQRKPFLVIGQDQRLFRVNLALEQALGYPARDLVGEHCCRLDATAAQDCRHRRFFKDLEPYVETHALLTREGVALFAHIQGFPVMDGMGGIYLGESLQILQAPAWGGRLIGDSAPMRELIRRLTQAAATEASVLLQGQTGSGKELAAHYVHQASTRAQGPFVVVDCTVLSEDLFESELFGHMKGSFTGAIGSKTGLIELANSGTLFLDEIGELPLSQQPKLLRALETGSYRPVGATQTRQADVRVVSATHRDLLGMVRNGEFRQDLYYRLAVMPIPIPALRERREDIGALVEHLLAELRPTKGRPIRLSPDAMAKLLDYDYPGNVRELRNLLHLGAALSPNGSIGAEAIHLPAQAGTGTGPHAPATPAPATSPVPTTPGLSPIEVGEARYIMELMHRHRGNRRHVAEALSVSERTLYRKLKRYGLNQPQRAEQS